MDSDQHVIFHHRHISRICFDFIQEQKSFWQFEILLSNGLILSKIPFLPKNLEMEMHFQEFYSKKHVDYFEWFVTLQHSVANGLLHLFHRRASSWSVLCLKQSKILQFSRQILFFEYLKSEQIPNEAISSRNTIYSTTWPISSYGKSESTFCIRIWAHGPFEVVEVPSIL